MYFWLIVVAAYIVSVVLSVVVSRYANRVFHSQPDMRDVVWSIVPCLNLVVCILSIYIVIDEFGLPRWIIKLYGGR